MHDLTIDFETHLISSGNQHPKPVVLGIKINDRPVELVYPDDRCLRDLFSSCARLIGANIPFDTGVLLRHRPDLSDVVWKLYEELRVVDVQIAARLQDIETRGWTGSYSLDALTQRFLKVKLDKDTWRLRYAELDGVPFEEWPPEAIEYPKQDVETTARLLLDGHVPDNEQVRVQTRTRKWLNLSSAEGLKTDATGVPYLKRQTALQLASDEKVLQRYNLLRWRKDTKGQWGWGLKQKEFLQFVEDLAVCSEETLRRTPSGQPSRKEEDLQHLSHELIPAYLNWSKQSSFNSTLDHLQEGVDGLIHTRYTNPLVTGRTSSSKPNIQNQRRVFGARECFVPKKKGKCFLAIDWSGQELHSWAQVCVWMGFESSLAAVLNAGRDVHTYVGSQIYGVSEEELRARSDFKKTRTLGKVANFGFGGSMTPYMLRFWAKSSYGLDLSMQEASDLHEVWGVQSFPEAADFFCRVASWFGLEVDPEEMLTSDAPAKYVYGRSFPDQSLFTQNLRAIKRAISREDLRADAVLPASGRRRARCTFTQACNYLFQGHAADANTHVGWLLANEIYTDRNSPLYGQPIVAYVHDEFIFECDEAIVDDVRVRAEEIMTDEINPIYFPDVPVSVESTAMDRWSKTARSLFEDGKIVVDIISVPWKNVPEDEKR